MRNYCLRNERKELVVFVLHSHSFCSFFFIELSSFRRFYLTGGFHNGFPKLYVQVLPFFLATLT
jgi:hypothetical protein